MYFSSAHANEEIMNSKQGVQDFMRAYNHAKSGDWEGNKPHPLQAKPSKSSQKSQNTM